MTRLSVILPTHGRPEYLRACLASLLMQDTSSSYEVVVVRRDDDGLSRRVTDELGGRTPVTVREVSPDGPGFLRALRAGLAVAQGDIVAFTDDDAIYPPDWLERLSKLFVGADVGGAGGTIREPGMGRARDTARGHGQLTVSGRSRGSAYDTLPPGAVDVDFLPGANMAYRRSLLDIHAFPLVLELNGGAPGNEILVGALVRRRGFRLRCDTGLVVEHQRAPRLEGSRIAERSDRYGVARSRSLIMRHALSPAGFGLFLLRIVLVGERELPGLVRLILERRLTRAGLRDLRAVIRGLEVGWRAAGEISLRRNADDETHRFAVVDVDNRCSPSS